jgi:hypothetical protein
VTYSGASEVEGIVGGPLVHIAEIPTIQSDYVVFVIREISSKNAPFERKIELALERAKSFVVSVAKDQQYEIRMSGVPSRLETLMNCNDTGHDVSVFGDDARFVFVGSTNLRCDVIAQEGTREARTEYNLAKFQPSRESHKAQSSKP